MNTKDKKKLRLKYVKSIQKCIINFDVLYKDTSVDISYFEELLMYAKLCDYRQFYYHHQRYNWPRYDHELHYARSFDMNINTGLRKLRSDVLLNRDVMLKNLDI